MNGSYNFKKDITYGGELFAPISPAVIAAAGGKVALGVPAVLATDNGVKAAKYTTDIVNLVGITTGQYPIDNNLDSIVSSSTPPNFVQFKIQGEFALIGTAGETYNLYDEVQLGVVTLDANGYPTKVVVKKPVVPAVPVLTQPTVAGATVPPGVTTVGLTYYGPGWETTIGATAQITMVAGNDLVVTAPAFPAELTEALGLAPMSGAKVYVSKPAGSVLYRAGDIDVSGGAVTFHLAADLLAPQSAAINAPTSHGLAIGQVVSHPGVAFPMSAIAAGTTVYVAIKDNKKVRI